MNEDIRGAQLSTPRGKPLRGLYPIVETPVTPDNVLDTETLAAEVRFINRGRVAGMIWLVFASSWDTPTSVRYAQHAAHPEGDQGRSRRPAGASVRIDSAHRQCPGDLGGWRRNGQSTAGRIAAGHRRPMPHAAAGRSAAAGDEPVLVGSEKDRHSTCLAEYRHSPAFPARWST
jgi:hypothetical protein